LKWIYPSTQLPPKETTPVETISSLTDKYIARQTARFLKTFVKNSHEQMETLPDKETVSINYNSSIDAVFYSQKELSETLKDENNELEKKWRAKILVEHTPRGNIIMFYDAYKQGFAYYSDQTGIPYHVLNAVSMKYVVTFRCRDFFVDETVLPEHCVSGITAKHEMDRSDEKKKKQSETPQKSIVKDKGMETNTAFAKFKSYNSVSSKVTGHTPKSSENVSQKSIEQQSVAPKITNKHISLGKTSNYSFLQKPILKTPEFETSLLSKKRMTYADFKRLSTATVV
jgi:hypothetical protein